MGPHLRDVQVEQAAGGTVVVFSGEHDLSTGDEIRELLGSLVLQEDLVVADFSSATFVDASIIGALLDTNDRARELGKTLRLQLSTATIVRRALEVCGVFEVMEHVTTREEALSRRDT